MRRYNVAVVGATGAVGKEMMGMLLSRKFPVDKIYAFASHRSAGRKLKFGNEEVEVIDLGKYDFKKLKSELSLGLALFSAGGSTSKQFAPEFVKQGVFVIDNSSAWRMDPGVPLVVPECNPDALSKDKLLIANPNCSTIQMVVVLAPIHRVAEINRVIVSTYQSVSGAGGRSMESLRQETQIAVRQLGNSKSILDAGQKDFGLQSKSQYSVSGTPHQIAFNVIPQIDIFSEKLYTKEEMKMVNETRKILSDDKMKISATCVRVPVFRGHSESVWIETKKKITPDEIRKLLRNSKGVIVVDNIEEADVAKRYPTPVDCAFEQATYVGRIREDLSMDNGIVMWIVSDNLLKGAALNAVQIAETLVNKKVLS